MTPQPTLFGEPPEPTQSTPPAGRWLRHTQTPNRGNVTPEEERDAELAATRVALEAACETAVERQMEVDRLTNLLCVLMACAVVERGHRMGQTDIRIHARLDDTDPALHGLLNHCDDPDGES